MGLPDQRLPPPPPVAEIAPIAPPPEPPEPANGTGATGATLTASSDRKGFRPTAEAAGATDQFTGTAAAGIAAIGEAETEGVTTGAADATDRDLCRRCRRGRPRPEWR